MNVEIIVQSRNDGRVWDVSELVNKIQWDTSIIDQPGKLSFEFLDDGEVDITTGSPVTFKVDGRGLFYGFVFNLSQKENAIISATAYDQMRYLKNKQTYVVENKTASQLFQKICTDFQLTAGTVVDTEYVCAPKIHDNSSLFDMMMWMLDRTMINSKKWYFIRDNYGKLDLLDIDTQKTNIVIGDESLLQSYQFDRNIDEDTYTRVRLIKENKDTQKREVYEVFDSNLITRWGVLQYFEKVDEEANAAQIEQLATSILEHKGRELRKLKLTSFGHLDVFAGCGIILSISDLRSLGIGIDNYFIVLTCSHKFENDLHTMDLEVQLNT